MMSQNSLLAVLSLLTIAWGPLQAEDYDLIPYESTPENFYGGAVPRSFSIVNDANLHDVAVVGNQCWAVGERGVILRSADSGMTWDSSILSLDCTLKSVCFLTNRIGFIAGIRLDSYSQTDRAVLLSTGDGGQTWQDVSPGTELPGLRQVRFFDLEHGVLVTAPANGKGGRLMATRDGGQRWSNVDADVSQTDWVNATFLRPNEGLVVGGNMGYAAVNNNQLIMIGRLRPTLRTVNAASLTADGRAWIVGDGGFIRRSVDRGVSWRRPGGQFPQEIRDIFRLTSVVHDGNTVCAAGSPGSGILRSDDAGTTWSLIPCASNGAIHKLVRQGQRSILAIGSWGMILKSDDFGLSWKPVRNGHYRSALMYLVTNPQDSNPLMLASVAGEQGYRVSVLQPSQESTAPSNRDRWQAALSQLGTNTFATDWRFARTRQQHGMSQSALLESWDASSDGRLLELLPLRLAVHIRTWKPDVICVESSGKDDAAATVWRSAIEMANQIASGSDKRSAMLDAAGLQPWSARRIVRRSHDESTALQYHADELLPTLRTTCGLIADTWYLNSKIDDELRHDGVAYAIHSDSAAVTPRELFQGLTLSPGSDGRRVLRRVTVDPHELQAIIDKHHTQKMAVTAKIQRDPMGDGLIAYTQTIGKKLPRSMAIAQLQHMLECFRDRQNMEGQIAILNEFTRRAPNSPQAAQAAEELHLLYSSAEVLTLRKQGRVGEVRSHEPSVIGASGKAEQPAKLVRISGRAAPVSVPGKRVQPASGVAFGQLFPSRGSEADAVDEHWKKQADISWNILNQLAPIAATTARQQLIKAARLRRLDEYSEERIVLANATRASDVYRLFATNEMQTAGSEIEPVLPAYNLPKSRQRPQLDGQLSDLCWQQSPDIVLKDNQPGDDVADSLVMLCWDEEFLFFSGHLPSVKQVKPADESLNRTHDEADITGDHIQLQLDLDRDYSTAWKFVIDSAGRTSDECWQYSRWNPEWYVATQRDETGWRFEAAIPIQELSSTRLAAGNKWAVNIRRIVPGYADQRLEVSDAAQELETRFSLIRFIRNRRPH
jgi:photosystem II stability/assembly factor-like uncharacterized protein